jgi:hypothetical protein
MTPIYFNRLPIIGTSNNADAAIPLTYRLAVLGTDSNPNILPKGNIPVDGEIIIIIIINTLYYNIYHVEE